MKKRLAYIDLVKVLAIFMVITLHNGTWQTDFIKTGNWRNFLQFSVRLFCEPVPIFMMINGFLLFRGNFHFKKHIMRTVRMVVIILCWSVFMDVFFTCMDGKPISLDSVTRSVLNTYIGNSHSGVLWFLQKLVTVYLVFPVLKNLYDTNYSIFKYFLIVIGVSTYLVNFLSLGSTFISHELYSSLIFFLNQYSVVFTTNIYMFFFLFGGFLAHDMDRISHKLYISLGILSMMIITGLGYLISVKQGATCSADLNYSQVFLVFSTTALFLLSSYIPLNCKFANKVLASIGDNTMGIYLLHRMVIWTGNHWIPTSSLSLMGRISMSCCVLLVSWGLTILIRKIPKVSFLVKL